MSRAPSMDLDAATAACALALGPRNGVPKDRTPVTVANRDIVRRWLTAKGVSSLRARGATLIELRACWEDTTDAEIEALCGRIPATPPTPPTAEVTAVIQPNMLLQQAIRPVVPSVTPPAVDASRQDSANSAATHLAAALAALTQAPAAIDEGAVRRICSEVLSGNLDALKTLQDQTRDAIADMLTGAPRAVQIVVNDVARGTLPPLRHRQTETLLAFVAQAVPAYVVGPAGSGKTHAAEQTAAALDLPFYLQGAASGAHEFLGFIDAHGAYQSTPFRTAFETGGVFLADEIDGSDPAALLVLNSALANGRMAFPDQSAPVVRHADFRMIAAANTYGTGADRQYVGRAQLDAATLDRFAFLDWPYDDALELQIAQDKDWTRRVQRVRAACGKLSIRHIVSPRASIAGGKMLAAGVAMNTVEDALLWRGLSPADVNRIRASI